jgi:hypothetical protein
MQLVRFRTWITPMVIGSFVLLSVTGVLMFFHLDSGLNKAVHEWFSWLFVAGAGLHLAMHNASFKKYLASSTGRWVMAGFVVLLGLSFVPLGGAGGSKPPFVAPMQALAAAPWPVVAEVAHIDMPELQARLGKQGVQWRSDANSVKDLVGADLGTQMRTLSALMKP